MKKIISLIIILFSFSLSAEESLLQKYNGCILENSNNLDDISVLQQNCYEKHLLENLYKIFEVGDSNEVTYDGLPDYTLCNCRNNNIISNIFFEIDVKKYSGDGRKIKVDLMDKYEVRFTHNIKNFIVEQIDLHIGTEEENGTIVYDFYSIHNTHLKQYVTKKFYIEPRVAKSADNMLDKSFLKTGPFPYDGRYPFVVTDIYGIKLNNYIF